MNNINSSQIEEITYKTYLQLLFKIGFEGYSEETDIMANNLSNLDPLVYGHGAKKAMYLLSESLLEAKLDEMRSVCHVDHEEFGSLSERNNQSISTKSWELNQVGINE